MRRDLPWRKDKDPYRVWVSEIMLQQTRIEAVKPYFARFMERFPDVFALANAEEEEVLKLWEGLGYYSRARNLHKAAKEVAFKLGGRFPATKEELKRLPGIGEYTSSSIASIAFDEVAVAVDGNLLRIHARLNADRTDVKMPEAKKRAEAFFLSKIDRARPGDFNVALMDIGELVCLPAGNPKCDECPFQDFCKAKREGKQNEYPIVSKKKDKRVLPLDVFILKHQGGIVLRKRPATGLMAGLYELPNIEREKTPQESLKKLGFADFSGFSFAKETQHVFTHIVYKMKVYEASVDAIPEGFQIVPLDEIEKGWPMPTCFKKLL